MTSIDERLAFLEGKVEEHSRGFGELHDAVRQVDHKVDRFREESAARIDALDRQSRFVLLVRVPGKDAITVVQALSTAVRALPAGLMASLTWDRGTELAAHKTFTVATNVQVYFCDPQSPWQRGTNENTNGLLRHYFPKGTDLSTYTQADLDGVAQRLNSRPRKTLGYATPADRLAATVASTG